MVIFYFVLVNWCCLAVINFQVNMQDRFGQVMIQNLRVHVNYNFEFVVHVHVALGQGQMSNPSHVE